MPPHIAPTPRQVGFWANRSIDGKSHKSAARPMMFCTRPQKKSHPKPSGATSRAVQRDAPTWSAKCAAARVSATIDAATTTLVASVIGSTQERA
jgi:hypothetical protein